MKSKNINKPGTSPVNPRKKPKVVPKKLVKAKKRAVRSKYADKLLKFHGLTSKRLTDKQAEEFDVYISELLRDQYRKEGLHGSVEMDDPNLAYIAHRGIRDRYVLSEFFGEWSMEYPLEDLLKLKNFADLFKLHPEGKEMTYKMRLSGSDRIFTMGVYDSTGQYLIEDYHLEELPEMVTKESVNDFMYDKLFPDYEKRKKKYQKFNSKIRNVIDSLGIPYDVAETSEYGMIVYYIGGRSKRVELSPFFGNGGFGLGFSWIGRVSYHEYSLKVFEAFKKNLKSFVEMYRLKEKEDRVMQLLRDTSVLKGDSFFLEQGDLVIKRGGYLIGYVSILEKEMVEYSDNAGAFEGLVKRIGVIKAKRIKDLDTVRRYIEGELSGDFKMRRAAKLGDLSPIKYSLEDDNGKKFSIFIEPMRKIRAVHPFFEPWNELRVIVKDSTGKVVPLFGDGKFPMGELGTMTVGELQRLYGTGLSEKLGNLDVKRGELKDLKELIRSKHIAKNLLDSMNSMIKERPSWKKDFPGLKLFKFNLKIVKDPDFNKWGLRVSFDGEESPEIIFASDIAKLDEKFKLDGVLLMLKFGKSYTTDGSVSYVYQLISLRAKYKTNPDKIVDNPKEHNLLGLSDMKGKGRVIDSTGSKWGIKGFITKYLKEDLGLSGERLKYAVLLSMYCLYQQKDTHGNPISDLYFDQSGYKAVIMDGRLYLSKKGHIREDFIVGAYFRKPGT